MCRWLLAFCEFCCGHFLKLKGNLLPSSTGLLSFWLKCVFSGHAFPPLTRLCFFTLVLFFFHSDPGKIILSSVVSQDESLTSWSALFFYKVGGKKRPACWLLDMWNVLLFWYLKLREHNKGVSWHSFCVFHCWDEWSAVFGENMTLAWWVKWAIISWDDTKQAGWGVFL